MFVSLELDFSNTVILNHSCPCLILKQVEHLLNIYPRFLKNPFLSLLITRNYTYALALTLVCQDWGSLEINFMLWKYASVVCPNFFFLQGIMVFCIAMFLGWEESLSHSLLLIVMCLCLSLTQSKGSSWLTSLHFISDKCRVFTKLERNYTKSLWRSSLCYW